MVDTEQTNKALWVMGRNEFFRLKIEAEVRPEVVDAAVVDLLVRGPAHFIKGKNEVSMGVGVLLVRGN